MLVENNVALEPHNSFHIVAKAQTLIRVRSEADVAAFLALEDVFAALRQTITLIRERCDTGVPEEDALLTIIITDGTLMAATQGGKELFVSTYKTRCADRDECKSLSPECEAPTVSGYVNHLVLSSERIAGSTEANGIHRADFSIRMRNWSNRSDFMRQHLVLVMKVRNQLVKPRFEGFPSIELFGGSDRLGSGSLCLPQKRQAGKDAN